MPCTYEPSGNPQGGRTSNHLGGIGLVAQLGEHHNGIVGVKGSIPFRSTGCVSIAPHASLKGTLGTTCVTCYRKGSLPFGRWATSILLNFGLVAQLGECLVRNEEVVGSIPTRSTDNIPGTGEG